MKRRHKLGVNPLPEGKRSQRAEARRLRAEERQAAKRDNTLFCSRVIQRSTPLDDSPDDSKGLDPRKIGLIASSLGAITCGFLFAFAPREVDEITAAIGFALNIGILVYLIES